MKNFIFSFIFLVVFFCNSLSVTAKSGCCSHHTGVAGCNSSGRQICNDGTLSPTCTCTPSVSYIYGCMDTKDKNYNASADRDDGSCILKNYGCIDIKAINYDDRANIDDHSCKYKSIGELNNMNHNLLDVIFWIVSKIISNII